MGIPQFKSTLFRIANEIQPFFYNRAVFYFRSSVRYLEKERLARVKEEEEAQEQSKKNSRNSENSVKMVKTSLGIDFGTSGSRAIVLNAQGTIVAESRVKFTAAETNDPQAWKAALETLLNEIPVPLRSTLERIAINGTSGTVLLCDDCGEPVTQPLLYNDDRGQSVQAQLQQLAPPHHLVHSSTSSLAKLLWWRSQHLWTGETPPVGWHLLHQADWLAAQWHGQRGVSDYHNALKLGYDVERLAYPPWLTQSSLASLLPPVLEPGQTIAPVSSDLAQRWNLPAHCEVCAGTTDSIAAFLASGLHQSGYAVTSLGSTLVLKLLSDRPVNDLALGIYSHRLGDRWLVGGASNTGGAVLSHFFSASELQTLSAAIDPSRPTALNYYPLLKPGERFPLNDPHLPPCLEPRPSSPVAFLQGLLEGMARIEAQGYQCLSDRGANPVSQVYTAGGGAENASWTQIRSHYLGVPVQASAQGEAAYGTALLAQTGLAGFKETHFATGDRYWSSSSSKTSVPP